MADRGWTVRETAARLGMSTAAMSSRLNLWSAWTVYDLANLENVFLVTHLPGVFYAAWKPEDVTV